MSIPVIAYATEPALFDVEALLLNPPRSEATTALGVMQRFARTQQAMLVASILHSVQCLLAVPAKADPGGTVQRPISPRDARLVRDACVRLLRAGFVRTAARRLAVLNDTAAQALAVMPARGADTPVG
jgi:hypothetical protein